MIKFFYNLLLTVLSILRNLDLITSHVGLGDNMVDHLFARHEQYLKMSSKL